MSSFICGTAYSYNHGRCRCALCLEAVLKYNRAYRARIRAEVLAYREIQRLVAGAR